MAAQDVHNFSPSSSSPHRLPTVTASKAFNQLSERGQSTIPTGIAQLGRDLQQSAKGHRACKFGIESAKLTEIYGPPGVGKTALAIQLSASVLSRGQHVMWVDTSQEVPMQRLKDILGAIKSEENARPPSSSHLHSPEIDDALERFHHFNVPSLSHLLAMLHPSSNLPCQDYSLLVIDPISNIFQLAFPRLAERGNEYQSNPTAAETFRWAMSRRGAVLDVLVASLERLAATKMSAIILINQTTTRMREEEKAVLHPVIAGNTWEKAINTRIVLFRDWPNRIDLMNSVPPVRFAGVMKANGTYHDGLNNRCAFKIEEVGLSSVSLEGHTERIRSTKQNISLKRRRVSDSESEDEGTVSDREYNWDGDESTLNDDTL